MTVSQIDSLFLIQVKQINHSGVCVCVFIYTETWSWGTTLQKMKS